MIKYSEIRRYGVFLIGGGLGALLNLAVTYLLTEFLSVQYLVSYLFGCSLNIVFNFLFHQSVTFGVYDQKARRFLKSVLTSIGAAFVIIILVYFFTEYLKLWYIASGVLAIGITSIINYLFNKSWVFCYGEK